MGVRSGEIGIDRHLTVYVAMLRGINVGGQNIVTMEKLRASFEALGFRKIRTYVQSGNVIFEATKASSENLSRVICLG